MIKEIIYDFDGTISDTYSIFAEAFLELLRRHGVEETYENAYKHLKVSVGHAISQYNCFTERPNPEFHEIHNAMALERQMPLEGALDILKYACENGGRNYIYTHSSKKIVYPLLVFLFEVIQVYIYHNHDYNKDLLLISFLLLFFQL